MNNDTPADAMQLKPCPFCGGEAVSVIGLREHRGYGVRCGVAKCYAAIGCHGETEEQAAQKWNTRTASLAAQVAAERESCALIVEEFAQSIRLDAIHGNADPVEAEEIDKRLAEVASRIRNLTQPFRPAPSLAAQDSWTAKRVAELVEQGDGFWQSCSGCHETNDGAETGNYPFNPVFKTYQGAGCHECGGIGVVWDNTDYREMAEFCLNADCPAPSLAAQDGLVDALRVIAIGEGCMNGIREELSAEALRKIARAALASIEVKSSRQKNVSPSHCFKPWCGLEGKLCIDCASIEVKS